MSARPNDLAMKQIGRLFRDGTVAGLGDGDLLARFVARRDETAFEALVSRHGPMVLGVCRRMLTDPHEADDAFQATFLVLVRKARGIRDADRLAPWLYGVAHRVAGRARIRAARRARNETTAIDVESADRAGSEELIDVRSIIDAELARLSVKHREVLVLCLLEGLSPDEAAVRLRCPTGTIKSRLARGRETLKGRLTARGVTPAVVASAVLGSAEIVRASSVPERLLTPLLRAAVDPAVSLGLGVATLTREAMLPMVSKTVKLSALVVAGIGLGSVGIVEVVRSTALARQAPAAIPTVEEENLPQVPPSPTATVANGPAVESRASAREVTVLRMKKILRAFHNYHSLYEKLPFYQTSAQPAPNEEVPPASDPLVGPPRKAKLSWRVAILPFLNENALYQRFHLDEPWDSENNLVAAAQMPEVFQTLDYPAPPGQTRLRVFSGRGTAFDGDVSWSKVLDGLSNTATLAISAEPVPWTKPEGIEVVQGRPVPKLLGKDEGGILLGMLDGAVIRINPVLDLNEALMRALTSIAGGERIGEGVSVPGDSPSSPVRTLTPVLPTPPVATPGPPRTGDPGGVLLGPARPTPPPSIEQRLEAIERKLDLLLEQSKAKSDASQALPSGGGLDPNLGGGFR